MRAFLAGTLAALVSGSLGSALGAELHVGEGQAYATIQSAADAAMPGDEILVHAGEYDEALELTGSGSEDLPIFINGAVDGDVTIRGTVSIEGSHWTLFALTLEVTGTGRGVRIDGDYNRLLELHAYGGTNNGIDGGGRGNEILESEIHDFDAGDSDAHCIVLNPGAEDWVIMGNNLFDCSGDGIQLYGPSGVVSRDIKNTTIANNDIHWSGGIARMENAIDVKNADGLVIDGNTMYGFTDNKTMVFQKGPIAIDVRCNTVFDGFTGVEFRGEDGGTVEDVTFEFNFVRDLTDYALKLDGVSGVRVVSNTFRDASSDGLRIEGAGATGGEVRNNLWVRTGALDAGSFDADHNGYFETGSVGFMSATDVAADPLLVDGYRLGDGSPMIDAGVDVGRPFAGPAPDIGAFEADARRSACQDVEPPLGAGGGGSGTGGESNEGAGGSADSEGGGGSDASDGAGESGCACYVSRSSNTPLVAVALAALLMARSRRRRR